MGMWAKLRMAGYLGLAMIVGYWMASRVTLPSDVLLKNTPPSGITASIVVPNEQSEPSVYYRDCNEAWAAGAAPIYKGEPGYELRFDGDNDGIACEPYYGPVKHFGRKTSERRKNRYSASP
jgi:hypothetical protein